MVLCVPVLKHIGVSYISSNTDCNAKIYWIIWIAVLFFSSPSIFVIAVYDITYMMI